MHTTCVFWDFADNCKIQGSYENFVLTNCAAATNNGFGKSTGSITNISWSYVAHMVRQKRFTKAQCLEMDLALKMVQGKTNVFSISGWNNDTKRMYLRPWARHYIHTFCESCWWAQVSMFIVMRFLTPRHVMCIRRCSNSSSRSSATCREDLSSSRISRMATRAYESPQLICVKSKLLVSNCSIYFTIILIAVGLGDYLHLQDPSREWQEHFQHVLMFCKTHVQRNFAKKFPLTQWGTGSSSCGTCQPRTSFLSKCEAFAQYILNSLLG